jgi:hypothetical protein
LKNIASCKNATYNQRKGQGGTDMIAGLIVFFLIWYFFVYRVIKPHYEECHKEKYRFRDSFKPSKWTNCKSGNKKKFKRDIAK